MNSITQILEEINNISPKYKTLLVLNQKQTAEVLGVSSSTLESWRKEGVGPEYIKQGDPAKKGRVMYPKTALAVWLSNTTKTA